MMTLPRQRGVVKEDADDAFKEEENQSSCNKAEKFYETVNPILKEQQNKWQKKISEVRQSLTEEKE